VTIPPGRNLSEPDTLGELPDAQPGRRARALLRAENLAKFFPTREGLLRRLGFLHAVDGVNLHIRRGETLGLVGESGCGKSTLGRTLVRLVEPTYGRIVFDGKNLVTLGGRELRALRKKMQIIFQDPNGSLNPKLTIEKILGDARRVHGLGGSREEETSKLSDLLTNLGLRPKLLAEYPRALSAGERQRIGIARALAVEPEFIVCDEPVGLLDAATQARVIDWIRVIQDKQRLALLFIAHDLRAIQTVSHRVAVMYLGKIVETAKTSDLLERRYHPYTRALVSAMPVAEPGRRRLRVVLEGEMPNPLAPPPGCAFHPRCPRARKGTCDKETPTLEELEPGSQHLVACFFPET
jgi:oligopeptide transport system ATP-binding protein